MLNIGIDANQGFIFEGDGSYGRLVWPSPVVTHAKIVYESEGKLSAESSSNQFGWRFREDSFDPVSRIRRGRFYEAEGGQPKSWFVQPHPALRISRANEHENEIWLQTFYGRTIFHKFIEGKNEQPLVILGVDARYSIWSIVNIEAISTGEDLVTLKARSSLGVLPKIDYDLIPDSHRNHVKQSLESFSNEVYRSAPISVIDRARDAASQILLAYFGFTGADAKDLGDLIKMLDDKKCVIASSAAKIIARLHARAKPVERAKREMRSIREQDAELAAQCVGTILCEIAWADWA